MLALPSLGVNLMKSMTFLDHLNSLHANDDCYKMYIAMIKEIFVNLD